jgi:phosphate-selective porin
LGLRYGELTMDETLFGAPSFAIAASANKIRSWGAVLNWLLNKNVKVSLDYDQTDFRGGSGAAHQVTAQDEKVIFTRFQVSF